MKRKPEKRGETKSDENREENKNENTNINIAKTCSIGMSKYLERYPKFHITHMKFLSIHMRLKNK